MTVLAVTLSYVVGSVPTGLWLGLRLRGIDIRLHGSKNIGATNALRVLGKKIGATALLADIAKGAVSVLLISRLSDWPHAPLVCGLAAIVGHSASAFLKFRGGKGIATSAGVFGALCPVPTLMALGAFAVVLAATRMVSAGSICAAALLASAIHVMYQDDLVLRAVASAVAALVIIKHRANIGRIIKGEENRLGGGKA